MEKYSMLIKVYSRYLCSNKGINKNFKKLEKYLKKKSLEGEIDKVIYFNYLYYKFYSSKSIVHVFSNSKETKFYIHEDKNFIDTEISFSDHRFIFKSITTDEILKDQSIISLIKKYFNLEDIKKIEYFSDKDYLKFLKSFIIEDNYKERIKDFISSQLRLISTKYDTLMLKTFLKDENFKIFFNSIKDYLGFIQVEENISVLSKTFFTFYIVEEYVQKEIFKTFVYDKVDVIFTTKKESDIIKMIDSYNFQLPVDNIVKSNKILSYEDLKNFSLEEKFFTCYNYQLEKIKNQNLIYNFITNKLLQDLEFLDVFSKVKDFISFIDYEYSLLDDKEFYLFFYTTEEKSGKFEYVLSYDEAIVYFFSKPLNKILSMYNKDIYCRQYLVWYFYHKKWYNFYYKKPRGNKIWN